jgi:hypothetical protein
MCTCVPFAVFYFQRPESDEFALEELTLLLELRAPRLYVYTLNTDTNSQSSGNG